MRRTIISGLWVTVVTLMLALPAYAHTGTVNGGNGGLGNGMGHNGAGTHSGISSNSNETRMYDGTSYRVKGAKAAPNYEVSIYGTGTGSQFRTGYAGVSGTTKPSEVYRTRTYTDGGYRTTATTPARGGGWAWLGLLGLIGLAGIWSRNPQRKN
ncbi:WGxxGxxG family protein [Cohnella sp. WQ 127256]|uniref:WGxxGxxG family protein n=1 Tax=Cohnella sp. WQ 127256 TaxID=2938790 RepID=UPI0021186909|nr:WGxxGxxG family protein [Cohnella sp. WQ 127256]